MTTASSEVAGAAPRARSHGTGSEEPPGAGRRLAWRALPWLCPAGLLAAALVATGTPAPQVAAFAAYWAAGLVLPGVLVYRALRGTTGSLAEDIGFGAVTGLTLEAGAWAVGTYTGAQHWLWVWPVPVVAAFALIPRLRRHWRIAAPAPLPLRWSWAVATVMAGAILATVREMAVRPLPPAGASYDNDLFYFLSIVHELRRAMPFETPQLAGTPLEYHYLTFAHMASASLVTGIEPAAVLLHLWAGPVLAAGVLILAALARQLSGMWWAGPLAAAGTLIAQWIPLSGAVPVLPRYLLSFGNPSLTYLLPFLLATTAVCVDLARGRRLGTGWLVLAAFGVMCAGIKPNGLPVLIAGLACAALAATVLRRRPPWACVAGIVTLGGAAMLGRSLFAGVSAQFSLITISLFEPLRDMVAFRDALAYSSSAYAAGVSVLARIAAGGAAAWVFAIGMVCWWLLLQAPRLIGLLALRRERIRRDPAAWLLAGAVVAGLGGMWLLNHPDMAVPAYFFRSVAPLAVVLAVWLLADARAEGVRWTVLVAGGLAAFVVCWTVAIAVPVRQPAPTPGAWAAELALPLVTAGATAIGLLLVVRRQRPSLVRRVGLPLAVAATLGAGFAGALPARLLHQVPIRNAIGLELSTLSVAEARAALWLGAHADAGDVLATNVHCVPAPTVAGCPARASWVSGLSGRRVLLEGWGYSDAAFANNGRGGLRYTHQPAPDPDLLELNDRVFTAPTAADIDLLRARHHVSWLFAHSGAGPVSADLSRYAVLRHTDGPVRIFEVNPAP
ncbi:hypothetical protein [Luedemannella helvata]|uniref:Uncharacterized protein n=1 Tax=Luedemannella helvata TaxID=349315 RepID=A0ABN2L315_9ACTN